MVGYFTGYFINGNLFHLSIIFIYPLLGYGIDKYGNEIATKYYALLSIFSLSCIVALTALYLKINSEQQTNLFDLLLAFTPLLCCGVFGTLKCVCKNNSNVIISKIGSTVFGVYLIEDIIRNQYEKVLLKIHPEIYVNDFLVGILFTIVSLITSVLVIYVFQIVLLPYRRLHKKLRSN